MEHIILMKACFWWHVWVRRVALFSRGNVCKPKQAVLCTSPKLGQKMLANESKSSSAVQSATRFLRRELRKICTSHKKKKKKGGGDVPSIQKVYSEDTEEMQCASPAWAWPLQLLSPDSLCLAGRAACHAAVKTVIFVGCCFPPDYIRGQSLICTVGVPLVPARPTMRRLLDLLS